ncbi:Gp37-like protein [Thalassiella azotivora]
MPPPFKITVFDKTYQRLGWVGDPMAVTVTPRHNLLATATLTIPAEHREVPNLAADGARVTIDYHGTQILSGPCQLTSGRYPARGGDVTFTVEDDFRVLRNVLGWPVPGAALTAQNVAYDVRTGPAETVLKAFAAANATARLGLPLTIATDQGRGATITASTRFHPLVDRLYPAVEQAGLGVTVRQQGTGLVLDCYEPQTWPQTLTDKSGAVLGWEWSRAAPTATRVIAGDQGEGTARTFTGGIDTAREAAWGDVIEVFRDARDTDAPEVVAERIAETLAEGAPTSGLKLELTETPAFRYDPTGARGVRVGDVVAVRVAPDVVISDVLREVSLSWTVNDGLAVTPVIGDRSDDPDTLLARAVAGIARGLRNINVIR